MENLLHVSKGSIEDAIQYFSGLDIATPEQLGLFFFFKSIGVNSEGFTSFKKTSVLTQDEKNYFNNRLHHLGGIYDPTNESGGKRTCLFPFSISENLKQKQFYNGGSVFKMLLSRINDTIDNTLVNKYLEKDEDKIKFKRNYINIVKEEYLKDVKISMLYFSIWFCRFLKFEVDSRISSQEFARLCVKYTKNFLNLTEKELQEFFHDEYQMNKVKFSNKKISGDELRELLTYEDNPEIELCGSNDLQIESMFISLEESRNLIELNGNNPHSQEILDVLNFGKQLILCGVPGVGKSKFIKDIEKKYDNSVKVQFHPSTSYQDFIGGSTIENGNIVSTVGKFLEFCVEASKQENKTKKYLFVIEEINRGNISKIFGETILTLDREYDVDLIKPLNLNGQQIQKFKIPNNLHIIATMNSHDKSISSLDYAIRRRFSFVKLYPNYEVVKNLSEISGIGINIEQLFRSLNEKINNILEDEELLLGQSYFLPNFVQVQDGKLQWTKKDLRMAFNYSILPILEEYTSGDKRDLISILGEKLCSRINSDSDFISEIKLQFPKSVL